MLIGQKPLLVGAQRRPPAFDPSRAGVRRRDQELVDAADLGRVGAVGSQSVQRRPKCRRIPIANLAEREHDRPRLGDGFPAQIVDAAVVPIGKGFANLVVDVFEIVFQRDDVPRGRPLGFGQRCGNHLQIDCDLW